MTMEALRTVVAARLKELNRNPFEAARAAEPKPLERGFINDLLIQKKKSVGLDKLPQLASALDWTAADLLDALAAGERGGKATNGRSPASTNAGLDREAMVAALEISLQFLIPREARPNLYLLSETVAEIAINPPFRTVETDMKRIDRNTIEDAVRSVLSSLH
ncbi:MAG: hypothetical protein WDN46_05045 [Methylocella sp.]